MSKCPFNAAESSVRSNLWKIRMTEASVDAIAGAVGSCFSIAITYPLTNVSTWQALEHSESEDSEELMLYRKWRALPSPIRELIVNSQTKGWSALYAGFKPTIIATAVSQGCYFYMYSALRKAIVVSQLSADGYKLQARDSSRGHDIGILGSIIVASLAGCGNVVVTNPIWVVVTQLQALQRSPRKADRYKGMMDVVRQLFREGGLRSFWKGLLPALVMVSNPTIQFILYEWLTARLIGFQKLPLGSAVPNRTSPPLLSARGAFAASALAKLGATCSTYPLLVIKSRLQGAHSGTAAEARYRGVLDAAFTIVRRERLAGLYKGMQVKLSQTVLGAAILMAIKERLAQGVQAMMMQR